MKLYIDNNDHVYELKEIDIIVQDAAGEEIASLTKKIDVSDIDEQIYCLVHYDTFNNDMKKKITEMISKHTSDFILYGTARTIKFTNTDPETLVTEIYLY